MKRIVQPVFCLALGMILAAFAVGQDDEKPVKINDAISMVQIGRASCRERV